MTDRRYLATFQQRNLYMHHAAHPADPSFDLGFVYRFDGDLDVDRLVRAMRAVLGASPGIATHFVSRDGAVEAVVGAVEPDVQVEPAPVGNDTDRLIAAQAAEELARGPIDPSDPHQLHVRFFRSRDSLWMRLIGAHIIGDAYSFFRVMGAVGDLYRSQNENWLELLSTVAEHPGTTVPTPVLPRALESYDALLAPVDAFTHASLAAPRIDGRINGRREVVRYEGTDAERIRGSRAVAEFGAATVFFAAYAATLQRLSGTETVVLGVPLGNRSGYRARSAVGFYVNTLPLPVTITAGQTWWELCTQVKAGIRLLQANQGVDLTGAQSTLLRGRAYPGLDNAVTFYKKGLVLDIDGARVTSVPIERAAISYPFVMTAADEPKGYLVEVSAAEHLLAASPGSLVVTALDAIVSTPDAPVVTGSVFVASPVVADEQESAQTDASDTVVSRIFAAARANPDRVALRGEHGDLTYAELVARMDGVGVALDRAGAGEAVVVAMPKSVDAVTVLLGVMASGRVHVPVDPSAPAARARLIVDRVAAAYGADPVVVTEDGTGLLHGATALSGARLVLDPDAPQRDRRPDPRRRPAGTDTAYVIFTSGSTGEPKGVVVPHSNVVDLLDSTDELNVGADDVWCVFHSLAFDFSVWEVFGALTVGATLVVPSATEVANPESFVALLRRERVTVLNQTPSAFRRLTSVLSHDARALPHVRLVVFGGEALYPADLRPWVSTQGWGARLVNMYGITETTVHVTARELTDDEVTFEHRSLIGAPLRHLDVLVVDPFGRPVPDGIAGELLVTGTGLAEGYLGRPDLTADRFRWVRGDEGARRAYVTGDKVLRASDGELVFVGRVDDQVQLRGYRIELGEVEAAFGADPDVSAVVVRLVEATGAEPFLAAWVAPAPGAHLTVPSLREAVAERIPGYMVPAAIRIVPVVPTNHNGKPDLAALPSPRATMHDDVPRPAGGLAARIAGVWGDVIGAGAVGIHDRFMDVGGTSMHVMAVHERLRGDLGLTGLSLVDLFEHATPAELAAHVAAGAVAERSGR